MIRLSIPLFLIAVSTGLLPSGFAADRHVAFIAAVSDYAGNAAIYDTRKNADALASTITELGFEVTTCFDFTKQAFEDSFQSWCEEAATADTALVYLSGHCGSTRPENYLFPLEVDFPDLRKFASECIPLSATLGDLAKSKSQPDRLDIFIVDGSRENPFLAGAKAFEEGRPNPSAFHSLGFVPRNTIAILPTLPDRILPDEHTGLLVEALTKIFFSSSDYKDAINTMVNHMEEQSSGSVSPKVYAEFNGTLSFDEGKVNVTFEQLQQLTQFDTAREAALKLSKSGEIPEAVSALVNLFDNFPDKQELIKSDLINTLTLAPVKDALVGKALIESDLFSLERLASDEEIDEKKGINLKEARKIFWSTGIWFSRHRDLARHFAEVDTEADDDEAKIFLARIFLKDDTPESDKAAVKLFEEAAANNSIKAINWLGSLYFSGRGVAQSLDKAEEYYQKATDLGSPRGVEGLAHVEAERQAALAEADRDHTKSARMYLTAINMKNYRPAANLSYIYWSEMYLYEEAAKILSQGAYEAVDRNNMYSLVSYIRMLSRANANTASPELEKIIYSYSEQELKELLLMAADLGHPKAISEAREEDLDYFGAAKSLCEEKGLSYEFWKFKQDETYETLRNR